MPLSLLQRGEQLWFRQELTPRGPLKKGGVPDHAPTMVSLGDGPTNTRGSAEGSEYVIVLVTLLRQESQAPRKSKQPKKDVHHNPGDAPHEVPTWSKAELVAGKEDVWRGLGGTSASGYSDDSLPGDRKHGVESSLSTSNSNFFQFKNFQQSQDPFRSRENVNEVKTKQSLPLEITNDALGANSKELVFL